MNMRRIFDTVFSLVCVCAWLWAAWYFGYWCGVRYVCELSVQAGHATKTEVSGATRYSFKAVKE